MAQLQPQLVILYSHVQFFVYLLLPFDPSYLAEQFPLSTRFPGSLGNEKQSVQLTPLGATVPSLLESSEEAILALALLTKQSCPLIEYQGKKFGQRHLINSEQ